MIGLDGDEVDDCKKKKCVSSCRSNQENGWAGREVIRRDASAVAGGWKVHHGYHQPLQARVETLDLIDCG